MQISVNMPFLSKTSSNFTIFQNYVEAKPQEPLPWNFAWTNSRLFAFRQKKSRYPNVITLGTIKVLLVPVAFENRVIGCTLAQGQWTEQSGYEGWGLNQFHKP